MSFGLNIFIRLPNSLKLIKGSQSLLKSGTGVLALSTFTGTRSIAACYIHFAPEENPEYLSHFGRWDKCSMMDKHPK